MAKLVISIKSFKLSISFNLAKFLYKNLRFIIMILDYILPKNDKKIIFNSLPDYADNASVFYNYFINNVNEKYKLYWILNNKFLTDKKYDNSYYFPSIKALYHILTSKYVVVTHTVPIEDIFYSKKRIIINLWHGMPYKTIGYIEPNLNNLIFKRYKILGKRSYMFATSDIFKQLLIPCFKIDYQRVFITGQPRTDVIWEDKNKEKIERIFQCSKFKKVVLYMPTYKETSCNRNKQTESKYTNIFYMNDYDERTFVKYLESNNILFIMKPHPFEEEFYKTKRDTLPRSNNFMIVYGNDFIDNDMNTYELFRYVDLLISDFSSVSIDYMILNKPVIYLSHLINEYGKNRGLVLEDNTKFLMLGSKVNSYNDLLKEMGDNLEFDYMKKDREKILPLLHKYPDNKACERIFNIMRSL